MKTTALVAALMLSAATAFAGPYDNPSAPPTAPPGSGPYYNPDVPAPTTSVEAQALHNRPAPEPPPGAGTAEWTFRRTIIMEAPILFEANTARWCGLRSSAWYGQITTGFSIINTKLFGELRPSDPARLRAYADLSLNWLAGQTRPTRPINSENCAPYLERLPRLDAVVDQMWGYR